jgi:hypothetical protein
MCGAISALNDFKIFLKSAKDSLMLISFGNDMSYIIDQKLFGKAMPQTLD